MLALQAHQFSYIEPLYVNVTALQVQLYRWNTSHETDFL